MGWLYGWHNKEELVTHLLNQGENFRVLIHRVVGNHLWAGFERTVPVTGEKITFVCLFLMAGGGGRDENRWGYKDIDESMGPCELDCPLSVLDATPLHDPENSQYAVQWRERVRAYHAEMADKRKLKSGIGPGCIVQLKRGCKPGFMKLLEKSRTATWSAISENGCRFRLPSRYIERVVDAFPPQEAQPCSN